MVTGYGDSGMLGGSDASVIQGAAPAPFPEGVLPEGTQAPLPISGSAAVASIDSYDLHVSGFVQAEVAFLVFDDQEYEATFLPREIELDLEADYRDLARLRMDFNLLTTVELDSVAFASDLTDRDVFDSLVEQAYVEWSPWNLTLRVGKMNAPLGSEPLDARDRLPLGRSSLARYATPDLLTGTTLSYHAGDNADAYLAVVNGWDLTVDDNQSFTVGGGAPHRFGVISDGEWLYQGNLSTLIGVEQDKVNNLRWLIDYSASLYLAEWLRLSVELLYGEEEGMGYNKQKVRDPHESAQWWGGMITAGFGGHGVGGVARDLRAGLRLEYVHDHDLVLGLPHLPSITTLVGTALTLRYALVKGVDAALEYRVDFERGDVKGVSVRRNVASIFKWFVTQEVAVGLVGYF
jgi:hypothetical protein